MSAPLLLRAFVNERLTAAAEEIFQVFERTIAKYDYCMSNLLCSLMRLFLPLVRMKLWPLLS